MNYTMATRTQSRYYSHMNYTMSQVTRPGYIEQGEKGGGGGEGKGRGKGGAGGERGGDEAKESGVGQAQEVATATDVTILHRKVTNVPFVIVGVLYADPNEGDSSLTVSSVSCTQCTVPALVAGAGHPAFELRTNRSSAGQQGRDAADAAQWPRCALPVSDANPTSNPSN